VPPRPRPAGTKQYGFLTIKGSPIARIYINGLDTGKFLLYKRKLAVGTYKIHFVTSEGDVWETRVTIVAGKVINRVSKYKKK
jgi:D-aminopeptidase